MSSQPFTVPAAMSIGEVLQRFFGADQRHRAYPVVSGERLVGMVDRASLASALGPAAVAAKSGAAASSIGQMLAGSLPPVVVHRTETARAAALRLAAYGIERMGVVDDLESMRLVGIISSSDLLKPVRRVHEEEVHREGWWGSTTSATD